MKSFTEILAATVGALVGAVATLYFASGTTLEYKQRVTDSYFVVPDQIKSDLRIEHKGKVLPNISVVEIGIYNRSWWSDASDVTLYFQIDPQKGNLAPVLINKDFSGPKRLGKIGIAEIKTDSPTLISYNLKNLKRSKDNDYYLASFIFEGSQPPEISVSTNDKNLEIEPYSERRDQIIVGIAVFTFYSIIIAFTLYFTERSSKKNSSKFRADFKYNLLEKKPAITEEDAETILKIYSDTVESKKDRFSRFIERLFSKRVQ